MLTFKLLGEPKPKQSFRFAVRKGKDDKTFVQKYQPAEVVQNAHNIAWDIKSQLPLNFIPFDCPIEVEVMFVFSPPSAWSKKKMAELQSGKIIYKDTKPDLDNLEKQLWDAMAGLVYVNDSRICRKTIVKVYGEVPRTEIRCVEIEVLDLLRADVNVEIKFEQEKEDWQNIHSQIINPNV